MFSSKPFRCSVQVGWRNSIADWLWYEIGIAAPQSSSLLRRVRVADARNFAWVTDCPASCWRSLFRPARAIEYSAIHAPFVRRATCWRLFEWNWLIRCRGRHVRIGPNRAQISAGLTNSGEAGSRSALSWKDWDRGWSRILPQEPPRDFGRIEGSNYPSHGVRGHDQHVRQAIHGPLASKRPSSTVDTIGVTSEV